MNKLQPENSEIRAEMKSERGEEKGQAMGRHEPILIVQNATNHGSSG